MAGEQDDAAARRARAKRLRQQIENLERGAESPPPAQPRAPASKPPAASAPESTKGPESPRDFIQKRMRELDRRNKKSK